MIFDIGALVYPLLDNEIEGGGNGTNSNPPASTTNIVWEDGKKYVVIDGQRFVAQTQVDSLVGNARKEGKTQGKQEVEQERETASLAEQKKFEELYQKEKTAREAAENKAKDAELTATRIRMAAKHGLPEEMATRLQGDTESAIEEDAKAMAKIVKPVAAGTEETQANGEGEQTNQNQKKPPVNTDAGQGSNQGGGGESATSKRAGSYRFSRPGDISWNTGKPVGAG